MAVFIREVDLSSNEETIRLYESLKKYPIETGTNNTGRGNHGDITRSELPNTLAMLNVNMEAVAILFRRGRQLRAPQNADPWIARENSRYVESQPHSSTSNRQHPSEGRRG